MNSPDYAIHYGTKYAPNPHEIDGTETVLERERKIGELMDEITIDCKRLPDEILDYSHEIAEAVFRIMTHTEGDKLGRINDLIDYHARQYAEWKVRKL